MPAKQSRNNSTSSPLNFPMRSLMVLYPITTSMPIMGSGSALPNSVNDTRSSMKLLTEAIGRGTQRK
jgi:hypothetical protein